VRTAWCNRVIDSGDATDALAIGQDGHAAALRLLSVAGSGRRHPSCWGLDPISIASQLDASIRRAKSLVQVMRSTHLSGTVPLVIISSSSLAFSSFIAQLFANA
jgi:hypothetical protein